MHIAFIRFKLLLAFENILLELLMQLSFTIDNFQISYLFKFDFLAYFDKKNEIFILFIRILIFIKVRILKRRYYYDSKTRFY